MRLLVVLALLAGCASPRDMSRETSLAIVKLAKEKQ